MLPGDYPLLLPLRAVELCLVGMCFRGICNKLRIYNNKGRQAGREGERGERRERERGEREREREREVDEKVIKD